MLLSEIYIKYEFASEVQFIKEKSFDYLGLTASTIDANLCIFLDNDKFLNSIKNNVKMVITTFALAKKIKNDSFGICIVDKPREVFFRIHNYLAKEDENSRKEKLSVGNNCVISNLASIAKNNIIIGDNVVIEDFVVIKENVVIGSNSIIRSGAVIGGQGFEFKRVDQTILSVAHAGGVIIGENVEVQYNTCIDKGLYSWDNTIIEDNCKIDNLVHISHGVKIGKNTLIVANSGIGGRTEIGADTWIGFGTTIINGIIIGSKARANIGAVVTKSIEDGESYTGNFAIQHQVFIDNLKKMSK